MIVFSVTSLTPNPKLNSKVVETYNSNSRKINETTWLIAASGTSREVSDSLTISEGEIGSSAIVFATSGYFGRAPTDIWEWIKAKRELPDA